ncbi:MAG: hypothetical protein R6U88_06645 [Candidatus Bipolaricaulota bacterium]
MQGHSAGVPLVAQGRDAMQRLSTEVVVGGERFRLYKAGMKEGRNWFGVFPRDLLSTGLMIRDQQLLRETLRFCAHTMGKQEDGYTGEEPGRVLHELAHVERDGLSSRYNACETAQLFVLGARTYFELSEDKDFLRSIAEKLEAAGDYMLRHLREDIFWEDPVLCGGVRYMAHATYWKDSHLPCRRDLRYPVAYTLVQAQTVAALRALARLAVPLKLRHSSRILEKAAEGIVHSIWLRFWDEEREYPVIAIDDGEPVPGVSSDGLHMLAYLEPGDVPSELVGHLQRGTGLMATPYGLRSYAPGQPDYSPYAYHLGAIWPHEQVFLAHGARAHGLEEPFAVSRQVLAAISQLGFVELYYWTEVEGLHGPDVKPGEGCDLQLWAAAVPQALYSLGAVPG